MLKDQKILNEIKSQENNLLYFTLSGSKIYGTNNKDSDNDYRGIFANTVSEIFGLNIRESQIYKTEDIILHGLKKFVKLASNANPNVLELLFISKYSLFLHPLFKEFFIDNKELFLSQKCYYTYSGYAFSQVKKSKHKSSHGILREKYKAGIEEDPYDVKFATHTARLMLNGKEILERGTLHPHFEGEELEFLKRTIEGKEFKSATEFYNWVEENDKEMQISKEKTKVRHHIDIKQIEQLLLDFYFAYYEL